MECLNLNFKSFHLPAAAILVALWSGVQVSTAGAQGGPRPFQFVESWCLEDAPDYDRTLAVASSHGWPELGRQVLDVLSPLAAPLASKGWIVSDDSRPMQVLVITKGTAGSKTVDACTVGLADIDTESFEKDLEAKLAMRPQGEERDSKRIYKKFLVFQHGIENIVTLSLPLEITRHGEVVASVIEAR